MPHRLVTDLRRVFAIAALLGTLSGSLAPVCTSMAPKPASAEHCGDAMHQKTPPHGTPDGSSDHHQTPGACTMMVCVALPMPSPAIALMHAPLVSAVPPVEVALASTTPQHTPPPPRS